MEGLVGMGVGVMVAHLHISYTGEAGNERKGGVSIIFPSFFFFFFSFLFFFGNDDV